MARLEVKIGALELKNPVLTASGTFGYGEEFSDFIDLNRLGGFIIKGTTLNHREGNPYPRMAETPSGMLNAVGLQNKGVDYFIQNIYPRIKDVDSQLIVNVSGATIDDYVAVCEKLAPLDRINAIEVNISCPNVKQGGMAFGVTAKGAEEVVERFIPEGTACSEENDVLFGAAEKLYERTKNQAAEERIAKALELYDQELEALFDQIEDEELFF